MLPKNNRVSRKTIDLIFKRGRSVNSTGLTFKYIQEPGTPAISIIAPKSVAKSAVKRNSLRRRGYSILRKLSHHMPLGIKGVIILKSPTLTAQAFNKEIEFIFRKLQ